ncbi:hypothetical protein I552_7685 [Mycobacterium xenopi 3993]|nr:hypothetical protein I552_7685 [Mycobacterium xenopi 3993]
MIVAAAGNTGTTGSFGGGTACESNPLTDLSRPDDPRNWSGVTSVSIPSWWQPYVLSVASLTPEAQPSKFTMAGPWVGIAAPVRTSCRSATATTVAWPMRCPTRSSS